MITEIKLKSGKTVKREGYNRDFDDLILRNLSEHDIEYYAETELNMKEDGDCGCVCDIEDFSDNEIEDEAKYRGHILFICSSIADSIRVESLKESLV